MLQIRRYLKILAEAGKIIDDHGTFPDADDPGYRDALLIYKTAFRQLAASGMPLSEDKEMLRIDTDGDTFILRKKAAAGVFPGKEGCVRECVTILPSALRRETVEIPEAAVHDPGNREEVSREELSSKEGEHQAEDGTGESFEGDYEAAAEPGMAGDESLPDDYGMDETERRDPAYPDESGISDEIGTFRVTGAETGTGQTEQAGGTEAAGGEKPAGTDSPEQEALTESGGFNPELLEGVETEYERKEAPEMPDHMFKDDFTFTYTDIRITGANGKEAQAQVIIAPVSINEEYPRIICCTIQGEKSETRLSDSSRMKIRVGGFTVKVEGRMEDGKFKSSCVLPAHYLLEGARIETKVREFGTRGHILLEEKEEDLQIHIIPATFRNNASGNAEYIYFISKNGKETAGDTSVVKEASFVLGGKEYGLRCRWSADGILYSMAAEKGEDIGTDGDVQQT